MVAPVLPYPSFDELPLKKDGPKWNAWGLYGPNDQLGTLNLLTPQVVLEAAQQEIRTGQRVSLNWSMFEPHKPAYGRIPFEHKLWRKGERHAHDDSFSFNSQCSSQWDGLRHYGYQQHGLYYNGTTGEEIESGTEAIGIQHMAKEGIVGRGVLIDYAAYCDAYSLKPEIFQKTLVSVEELLKAWTWQGMTEADLHHADILFIRFGFTRAYEALSDKDREWMDPEYVGTKGHQIGIASNEHTLRWIWKNRFAAVAGDTRAFEAGSFLSTEHETYGIHPVCLAGWGLPIGELFDLEALSAKCTELKRWTFFLTSEVLNVPGGVASPPNALAIF